MSQKANSYQLKKSLLIFLCLSPISFAKEPIELSLQDALNLALVNNIDITISDYKIELATAVLRKNRARRFPKLGLTVDTGYKKTIEEEEEWGFELGGEQYTVESTSKDKWNNDLSLTLTQEIYTGGEISARIQEAYYEREIAVIDRRLARQDLTTKVVRAYWELKKAYLLVGLEEEMVKYARRMVGIAQKRLSAESIAPVEVARAKVELKNAEYDLVYSKKKREEREEDIAALLNINDRTIFPTDEPEIEPIDLDLERVLKEEMKLHPYLKRYLLEIEAKNSVCKVAKSALYPKINFSARCNLYGSNRDYLESMKNIKPSSWNIDIILSWPFYDKTIKENIAGQEKHLMIAKETLKKEKREIVHQIKKAYYAIISAKERIEMLSENVSLAEENLRIAQLEYESGKITTNELFYSQLKLREARYKEIEARIDYKIAQAEFRRATGGLR